MATGRSETDTRTLLKIAPKLSISFAKRLAILLIFSQGGITRPDILLDWIWKKISGAGFTGMNTKAGDLVTINFRGCIGSDILPNSVPSRMYCVLHYDAVLNIRDSGVELLD